MLAFPQRPEGDVKKYYHKTEKYQETNVMGLGSDFILLYFDMWIYTEEKPRSLYELMNATVLTAAIRSSLKRIYRMKSHDSKCMVSSSFV